MPKLRLAQIDPEGATAGQCPVFNPVTGEWEPSGEPRFPPGFIDGLGMTVPTTSTVQIASGSALDAGGAENLNNTGTLTADITVSGLNGLDTGTEAADTWYSVWVIEGGGNPCASLLSLSSTAPALPGSYDTKRRVGWVRNDAGSNLRNVGSHGSGRDRHVIYSYTSRADLTVFTQQEPIVWTNADCSEWIPPTSRKCEFNAELDVGDEDYVEFRTPGSGLANGSGLRIFGHNGLLTSGPFALTVDAARSLDYRRNDTSFNGVDLLVLSYWDYL